MTDSFEALFEQSLETIQLAPGSLVEGTVISITPDWVVLDVGLKSEAYVSIREFMTEDGQVTTEVGNIEKVSLSTVDDAYGETIASKEGAKRAESWDILNTKFENKETVEGMISGKVKGGFTVEVEGIRAFLPGSLVDVRPVRDTTSFEGRPLEFKIIKLDPKRNNVVVSRRAVVETESSADKDSLLASLEEGQVVKGVVKNLTDYGAFVDLGGIDGLLHITDMSWKRIKHPSEIVNVADEIDVKILKFDKERSRVSLGLKQLGDDPWVAINGRYPVDTRLRGVVTNITDYGCFVEIEEGVEGLVHVSEMDWTNKNINPNRVVQLGDEVDVLVLEIDEDRRRISLGIKQCQDNPWEKFSELHKKDEIIKGNIRSITDFGIFIGLDGDIDGLIHLSDLSWNETGEEAVLNYEKGQEIEAIILTIDPERERISLGIKQLESDPVGAYLDEHPKGTVVSGKIVDMDAKRALIDLADEVQAQLRINEISRQRIDDIRDEFNVGDEIEAKIMGLDRKTRVINLSIKALVADLTEETSDAPSSTLGDLLKAKMAGDDDKSEGKDS